MITAAVVLMALAFLVLAMFALSLVAGLMDGWPHTNHRWPEALEPAPWMLAAAFALFLFGGLLAVAGLWRL